jgi:hypothetical protein
MPKNKLYSKISNLIPKSIADKYKSSSADFTRNSTLTGTKLISFILSIIGSDKNDGIDIQSGIFFKFLRRNKIFYTNEKAVQRGAITKARKKLSWKQFKEIEQNASKLVYELWPDEEAYYWHKMNVIAIDGSKHSLPASEEIRKKYDPESCQLAKNRSYYPQGLVSVAYDVLRGIPIARELAHSKAYEGDEAIKLMNQIHLENVLYIMDRGYPSYRIIWEIENRESHFLIRCKKKTSFKSVEEFLKSGKKEDIIILSPKWCKTSKINASSNELKPKVVRAIRYIDKNGNFSALLTDLIDTNEYSTEELLKLYRDRWEIEINYRHEKCTMKIETVHSKSDNGILQEFHSLGFMSIITSLLISCVNKEKHKPQPIQENSPQFKNSIKAVASDFPVFIANNLRKALQIFKEILQEIERVLYRRPKEKRKGYPRYTKKACSKWIRNRAKFVKLSKET